MASQTGRQRRKGGVGRRQKRARGEEGKREREGQRMHCSNVIVVLTKPGKSVKRVCRSVCLTMCVCVNACMCVCVCVTDCSVLAGGSSMPATRCSCSAWRRE